MRDLDSAAAAATPRGSPRRPVTLGGSMSGNRLVLSGVRDGERVVLAPPASLQDGEAVKPAE